MNHILNAEQKADRLREKEKKKGRFVMDVNTVGRMTGKLEKGTPCFVASPATATKLREKETGEVLPILSC